LVLLAFTIAVFWRYLVLDYTLYAGDTAFVFIPLRTYVTQRLARGELPLWNPHIFGGTPALAEAQYQVFYLPNLLLLIAGVARGMGLLLAFHFLFAAVGTYFFSRSAFRLGMPGALVAALVYAFGATNQSKAAISVYLEAAAWLPWILVAYDVARKRGGPALILPPLFLAQQLCTGAPQYTYFTLVILAVYHGYCCVAERASRRLAWTAFSVTIGLGVLVATAQILPEWELARLSDRGTRASYEYATEFSLKPAHFGATMVQPWFFGSFDVPCRDGFFPGEESGYLGLLTLSLAAAGAVVGLMRRRTRLRTGVWLAVLAGSTLLAFGLYDPAYRLCYQVIPGLALFRGPARWLLLFGFGSALLAGFGLDALLAKGRALRPARATGTAVSALILIAAGALASAEPAASGAWVRVGLAAAGAGLLALGWVERRRERRLAPGIALGLICADLLLLSFGMEIQHDLPVEVVENPPPKVTELRTLAGIDRFAPADFGVPLERWQRRDQGGSFTNTDVRMQGAQSVAVAMLSCTPSQWGTMGISGAWGALMPLRRHAKPVFEHETSAETRSRWLRLLDVRYYVFTDRRPRPGLEVVSDVDVVVARDPSALPRAFVVGGVRGASRETSMAAVSDSTFDPRREVVLEDPLPPAATEQTFQPATIEEYHPERVRIAANPSRGGNLVLMDTFYPGWKAWVDGKPEPLRPANWVGRHVSLSPGGHEIEMRFEPAAVRVGLFFSLAGLALALGFATLTARSAGKR
jgi:hypothetical protein